VLTDFAVVVENAFQQQAALLQKWRGIVAVKDKNYFGIRHGV
jgi:hypothetical protein